MKLKACGSKVLCNVRYCHRIWTEGWRK